MLQPMEKELACGDIGGGAMKDWREIISVVEDRLGLASPSLVTLSPSAAVEPQHPTSSDTCDITDVRLQTKRRQFSIVAFDLTPHPSGTSSACNSTGVKIPKTELRWAPLHATHGDGLLQGNRQSACV